MIPLLEQAVRTGERFRVVYIEAVDPEAETAQIAYAKPLEKLWFRATRFDQVNGEFDFDEA